VIRYCVDCGAGFDARGTCDCGGSTLCKPSHLRRGEVVSCGCKRREDAMRLRLIELMSDPLIDAKASEPLDPQLITTGEDMP